MNDIKLFALNGKIPYTKYSLPILGPKTFRLEMPEYHASAYKDVSFFCNLLCLPYVVVAELLIVLSQNLVNSSTDKYQCCFTDCSTVNREILTNLFPPKLRWEKPLQRNALVTWMFFTTVFATVSSNVLEGDATLFERKC